MVMMVRALRVVLTVVVVVDGHDGEGGVTVVLTVAVVVDGHDGDGGADCGGGCRWS